MTIPQLLISRGFLGFTVSLLAIGRLQAQISVTGGDLYVLQDGSGTTATYQDGGGTIAAGSGAGSPIFIDQFATSANGLVAQTAVPTTATAGVGLLTAGDSPQDGQLYYDPVGNDFVFGGYSGTAVGASKSTAAADLGTVNSSGIFSLAVQSSSSGPYTGSSGLLRAGITDGSGNYWASGTGSSGETGIYYYGNNSAQAVLNGSIAGRGLGLYGGNLYYTTGSGTAGLYTIAGTPTSGTQTPTLLASTGGTPYGFIFNSAMTTLYVANESGGIQKWTFNGSTWSLAYTLDSSVDFDWVTADFSGANPVLYATSGAGTSGNSIYAITDTGSGSAATILDTISASTADSGDFDGIVFVQPVPESSIYALAGIGLGLMLFLGNWRRRMGKA
jgi:hypothetical protein